MFTGRTGRGKSTLINSIIEDENNDMAIVGDDTWKRLKKHRFCELLKSQSQDLKNALTRDVPMLPDVIENIQFVPAEFYKASRVNPQPLCLPD